MRTQRVIVAFLLFIVVAVGIAAEPSFAKITQVRHLGADKGLSSHRVYSIVHDADNVLWISTKNGVDRFNEHVGGGLNLYDLSAEYHQLVAATCWWTNLPGTLTIEFSEDGVLEVVLTSDALALIAEQDGFIIVGHGFYVDLITLR